VAACWASVGCAIASVGSASGVVPHAATANNTITIRNDKTFKRDIFLSPFWVESSFSLDDDHRQSCSYYHPLSWPVDW
jgi:hypothetical protein